MTDPVFDPARFFDHYSDFLDSSETGQDIERLNARYLALIHENRDLLVGARVLDLASHDGRFSFAALQNGAEHVTGMEIKQHLVDTACEHMRNYGIADSRYNFLLADMFDAISQQGPFDVVFCFGILYHINDHMGLFDQIAQVRPHTVIIDSNVSQMAGTVIELRSPRGESPPPPGRNLEGYPTPAAIEAMVSSHGWQTHYFDWQQSGLCGAPCLSDYQQGKRLSVRVHCPEAELPDTSIKSAVEEVLDKETDKETLFILITMVAEKYGIAPQALRTWVHQAQRKKLQDCGYRRPE